MVFYKEEINAFNIAYFEKLCAALDSENDMKNYCRDTFRVRKGLVPDSDKDALDLIVLDLTHKFMYDTSVKRSKWGLMSIPHDLLNECADRILAKLRCPQAEEIIRAEAARKAMEETAQKSAKEAARKATEEVNRRYQAALRLAGEEPLNQEEVARMIESNPMGARFSSLDELIADMKTKGGRDLSVADLVKNHGHTPDASRKRKKACGDGVIYAIICRVDLCVYIGQTRDFKRRMCDHFGDRGHSISLRNAIDEQGRDNFKCVMLLAGIAQEGELLSAESAVIDRMAFGARGYNVHYS